MVLWHCAATGLEVEAFHERVTVAVTTTVPDAVVAIGASMDRHPCARSLCSTEARIPNTYKVPQRIIQLNMFHPYTSQMTHKTASLLEPFSCAVYGIPNCPFV